MSLEYERDLLLWEVDLKAEGRDDCCFALFVTGPKVDLKLQSVYFLLQLLSMNGSPF